MVRHGKGLGHRGWGATKASRAGEAMEGTAQHLSALLKVPIGQARGLLARPRVVMQPKGRLRPVTKVCNRPLRDVRQSELNTQKLPFVQARWQDQRGSGSISSRSASRNSVRPLGCGLGKRYTSALAPRRRSTATGPRPERIRWPHDWLVLGAWIDAKRSDQADGGLRGEHSLSSTQLSITVI